jgi:glycosyltransferase involved in cell wall biosynthesis
VLHALRREADVIVGHNVEGGLIAGIASRRLRAPAVYVRHTAFADELAMMSRWAFGRTLGQVAERCAERLAATRVQLAPHPRCVGSAQWEVIPPPADPTERPIEPADGTILYYEGNLDPYQNPTWLQVALEAARGKDPSVRLILGRGPHDRPRFADLALVPRSLPGGFPIKLLAYQVAGIPAVCVESGVPGLVDGSDAFVVRGDGSAEAFAARVVDALADAPARENLRMAARERALRRHDPARVAEMYEGVLRRAIASQI